MKRKHCPKCDDLKSIKDFCKDKNRKDGKTCYCKECQREWRNKHFDERKEYQKKYRKEHKKERTQYQKKRYQEHREERIQYQRKWRKENKGHKAKWDEGNKKKRNQQLKVRYNNDPWFRLNAVMSSAIQEVKNPSIKQGRSWKDLVPYTLIELRKHLKRTLPEDYTWKDFMQGKLHIDHILPRVIFQYQKAEDLGFQRCWSLENLRLLPVKENIRKRAKLIKPFQKHFDMEIKIKK